MALIELDTVKRHLRIMHNEDDAEIVVYQAAAEDIVTQYLDRKVIAASEALPDEGDDATAMHITPAITAAVLLMVGDMYEVREPDLKAQGDAVLPRSVRSLLAPYRVWRTLEAS
jgi:hypothetical protein